MFLLYEFENYRIKITSTSARRQGVNDFLYNLICSVAWHLMKKHIHTDNNLDEHVKYNILLNAWNHQISVELLKVCMTAHAIWHANVFRSQYNIKYKSMVKGLNSNWKFMFDNAGKQVIHFYPLWREYGILWYTLFEEIDYHIDLRCINYSRHYIYLIS